MGFILRWVSVHRLPSHHRHVLLLLASVLAVLSSGVFTAQAAPAPPAVTYAFSDSTVVPTPSLLRARLAADVSQCPAANQPIKSLSLGQAVSDAYAFLKRKAGGQALSQFDKSGDGTGSGIASSTALQGEVAGSPGLALASLLAAHRDQPTVPAYLVNASTVLTQVGRPNDALAFLNAAAKLKDSRPGPLGISDATVAKNDRAYALIALGHFGMAQPLLKQAIQVSPTLVEADDNLAEALNCQGKTSQAVRFLAAGLRRDGYRGNDIPNVQGEGSLQANPRDIFDLSAGTTMDMPNVKWPRSPVQAVGLHAKYQAIQTQGFDQAQGISNQMAAIHLPFNLPAISRDRVDSIHLAILTAFQEPKLARLYKKMLGLQTEAANMTQDFWGVQVIKWTQTIKDEKQLKATCTSGTTRKHAAFLNLMHQLDMYTARLYQAYSHYATGLDANIYNPAFHDYANLEIDQALNVLYYSVVFGSLWNWANEEWIWRSICVGVPGTPSSKGGFPVPTFKAAKACPDFVKGVSFKLKLKIVSFEVNCEKVKLEVATKGLISAFGGVEINPGSGKVTVTAGPKAGGSAGPFTISAKGGFYITVDKTGITDYGEKLSATVSANWGTLTAKIVEAKMDISLAGAFSP